MYAAVVQTNTGGTRRENLDRVLALVDKAAAEGAEFVLLPEYVGFLGPYSEFAANSEDVPGPTSRLLADKARQHDIYLHGGSLIEKSDRAGMFYNTSLVFNPQGEIVARYRKVHLFDVHVPGQLSDNESSTILPGEQLVLVDLPELRLGLSICFDLRFPEMYRRLALSGAEALVVPAAFTHVTGRDHWQVLLRARAIENHAYVLAAAQWGTDRGGTRRGGRSMIVDPWGKVLTSAQEKGDQVLIVDLFPELVHRRRRQMQVLQLRRPDVYGSEPQSN